MADGSGIGTEGSPAPYEGVTNSEGWPLSPQGYVFKEADEVGSGAFAKVIRAFVPSKDTHVAVKIMSLENLATSMEEIQTEVRSMKLLKHANVLDLHCCFVVKDQLWLVMPLMDKGSCYYAMRCLRRERLIPEGQGLPEDAIATIMKELLQGLDYIHTNHQVHRDIKAGNILLSERGEVKIADFGVAAWLGDAAGAGRGGSTSEEGAGCKTFVGTPCWMAPEVMEQQKAYNEKADVWSVGITALELAKGYAPYSKYPPMTVLLKTIREPPPSLKSYTDSPQVKFSDRFSSFVARCLSKDPRARPSAHELLSDPFIVKGAAKGSVARLVEIWKKVPSVGSLNVGSSNAAVAAGGAAGGGAARPEAASAGGAAGSGAVPEEQKTAPGTTWVFPEEIIARLKAEAAGVGMDGAAGGVDGGVVGGLATVSEGPGDAEEGDGIGGGGEGTFDELEAEQNDLIISLGGEVPNGEIPDDLEGNLGGEGFAM